MSTSFCDIDKPLGPDAEPPQFPHPPLRQWVGKMGQQVQAWAVHRVETQPRRPPIRKKSLERW